MSKKRLAFVFSGTVFYINVDEQDARKWLNHYLALKRAGQVSPGNMIWGDTWCVCLDKVVAVFITENEAGADEPWRESLRINPDEDE
jgi:hypothetical protein